MKRSANTLRLALATLGLLGATAGPAAWQVARPGWTPDFPRDHGNHPAYKTEWWYFTGNLTTAEGREFGYQLTFFRQGMRPGKLPPHTSRFVTRDLKLAHFAVTDFAADSFRFWQKLSRGAYGEAGFGDGGRLAWIDSWSCELLPAAGKNPDGRIRFRIRAEADSAALDLTLEPVKPPVIHGANGVSQKAEGEGRASHYYSFTRLRSQGALTMKGEKFAVTGWSWFDHEWATNQLAKDQEGWDWFSLQLEDGSELMVFQLRKKDGTRDRFSAGTFVAASGETTALAATDFVLTPTRLWENGEKTARYPVGWKIRIPKLDLTLTVRAVRDDQELRLQPVVYWEGAVRAEGRRRGRNVRGAGYLEMTGYAGPVAGMAEGR